VKYYVVSDVHGYLAELKIALQEQGFFDDTEPHKLIVCGDMMDRGQEANAMQEFMYELLKKDELIFIRGNHEDLMVDMLDNFDKYQRSIGYGYSHHVSNGTFDTALQLSHMEKYDVFQKKEEFLFKVRDSIFYKYLLPVSVDYFETEEHIFVHGWIPCKNEYDYDPDWRNAHKVDWEEARWFNGMKYAELYDVVERGKRIVCGHFHTSYGHSVLMKRCSEWGDDADFSPFYGKNILAIDACTAYTGRVNCVVIEE